MAGAETKVVELVVDVIGAPITDMSAFLRSDLKIDGDDGWILMDDISRIFDYQIDPSTIAHVFHDEAEMVLHRVILRKLGIVPDRLNTDLRLSELIQAITQGRSVELETM